MAPPELIEWLAGTDHTLDDGAESAPPLGALGCHVDLVDRLSDLGRFTRARRVFVGGCPVLVAATTGRPFAAAWDTHELVLRLGGHPGVIALEPLHEPGLADEWVRVDPYAQDVTFRRGTELLRDAAARAAAR